MTVMDTTGLCHYLVGKSIHWSSPQSSHLSLR